MKVWYLPHEKVLALNGVSDDEILFDRVKTETLLKLIDKAEYVYMLKRDRNLYGEFLFIGLAFRLNGEIVKVMFWGAGHHESSEKLIAKYWRFYWDANNFEPKYKQKISKFFAKIAVLNEIKYAIADEEYFEYVLKQILGEDYERPKRSKKAILFDAIAELTDEDSAYTFVEELEECGLI